MLTNDGLERRNPPCGAPEQKKAEEVYLSVGKGGPVNPHPVEGV